MWHLVRPTDEVDEGKSKRGSVKEKERTKAITEIYLTRLLSVQVGLAGRVGGRPGPPAPRRPAEPRTPTGHAAAVRGQLLPKRAGARERGATGGQVLLRFPGRAGRKA